MGATFQIISHNVGEVKNGKKSGDDVRRLQQLLLLNGADLGPRKDDGDWGDHTRNALMEYQQFYQTLGIPVRPWVEPGDAILLHLAFDAKLVIPLPANKTGKPAFLELHGWLERTDMAFIFPPSHGHNGDMDPRGIWGVSGKPYAAIATVLDKKRAAKFFKTPAALNCTTYANLMMSVWMHGNCHRAPYEGGVGGSGGEHHLSRQRYAYPACKTGKGKGEGRYVFESLEEVRNTVGARTNQLFCVEIARIKSPNDWFVKHMVLLLTDTIYESNGYKAGTLSTYVHSIPLREWWGPGRSIFLSGPSPV